MTDELNRLSSDREETDQGDSVPSGAAAITEHAMENDFPSMLPIELIPDWLRPMEEDDDAVEGDRIMERRTRKTIPNMFVAYFYLREAGYLVYSSCRFKRYFADGW